jgi:carbonic anhydrase
VAERSELDAMLEVNRRYAEGFDASGRPAAPARRVAILTCMDSRIHLEEALGLDIGDAHMLRNAGGRASDDAIRSLIVSSHLLGTREFAVVHHTDCGLLGATNEQLHMTLRERTGADAAHIDFLPFDDLRESVLEDVERILASPLLDPAIRVSGWIYDVDTGALEQVAAPRRRGAGT